MGSAEAVFLESKAREVQKRLKSEVHLRKRQGLVAFADDIASKPVTEAMRQMRQRKGYLYRGLGALISRAFRSSEAYAQ